MDSREHPPLFYPDDASHQSPLVPSWSIVGTTQHVEETTTLGNADSQSKIGFANSYNYNFYMYVTHSMYVYCIVCIALTLNMVVQVTLVTAYIEFLTGEVFCVPDLADH